MHSVIGDHSCLCPGSLRCKNNQTVAPFFREMVVDSGAVLRVMEFLAETEYKNTAFYTVQL